MASTAALFICQIAILLYAIILHEMSHGIVALWCGDPTAKQAGRLTLNPIPHIDLIGSIILPLFLVLMRSSILFGWAKPVPVNPYYFRNRWRDEILVSLAGPITNISLGIVFILLMKLFINVYAHKFWLTVLFYGLLINLVLAIFNLIPIPPLDGSHVVRNIFGGKVEQFYRKIEGFGFLILLAFLYFGLAWRVINFFLKLVLTLVFGPMELAIISSILSSN